MPHEQNKGQAGMGGRGKNQAKGRQDQATRNPRGRKRSNLTQARNKNVPGSPSGVSRRQNQKRNQREWHDSKIQRIQKEYRAAVEESV